MERGTKIMGNEKLASGGGRNIYVYFTLDPLAFPSLPLNQWLAAAHANSPGLVAQVLADLDQLVDPANERKCKCNQFNHHPIVWREHST